MTNEEIITSECTEVVSLSTIFSDFLDPEIEARIDEAVSRFLMFDDRFGDADPEIVDAIGDWFRAKIVVAKTHNDFMKGETTASMERMYRYAMTQKNILRDEIFKKYRGRKAKKEEIDYANMILVDTGDIKPQTEVDILD